MGEYMIPSELPEIWHHQCKCQLSPVIDKVGTMTECPIGGLADISGKFYVALVGGRYGYWVTSHGNGLALFRRRVDALEFGALLGNDFKVGTIEFDDAVNIVKQNHEINRADYVFVLASKSMKFVVIDQVFVPKD